MICYSVQPRDHIFVKSYGFLSFAKNISENVGKNISKNLCGKYSQNVLIMLKNPQQSFKTASKKSNSKNSRSNW